MKVILQLFLGFAVLAGLSVSLVHAGSDEIPQNWTSGAQSTIDGQFQAFRDRDHLTAFSKAAPQLQQLFGSVERFVAMVKKGYGVIYDAKGWSFGRTKLKDGLLFQEVQVNGPNGRQWTALYTMRQLPDGSWRIAAVQLLPGAGFNT